MKLFSSTIESSVVRTICSGGKVGEWCLGAADAHLFHTELGVQCISRIRKILEKSLNLPRWDELVQDPVLSVGVRNNLRKNKPRPYTKTKDAKGAIKNLRRYAAMRKYAEIVGRITTDLDSDAVDVDEVSDYIAEAVSQVRLGSHEAKMYKFGAGNNTDHIVEYLLTKEGEKGIPTGFRVWDERNGTVPNSAVMLIASTTGGGKSIMAATLCKNLAENGMRPCVIPLEMSVEEMTARLLSAIGKVAVHKVLQGSTKVTQGEQDRILKNFRKWTKRCKRRGGSYLLYEPATTVTMLQALHAVKAYAPSCIIIDYVALLDGVDGDNDWRKLSEAVRDAKRFAKMYNIPVIVLAQLSNSMELRYSKRMMDDADIAWFWVADDAAKESGIIYVRQTKARNRDPFPFELYVDWEHTIMRDVTDQDREKRVDSKKSSKGLKDKSSNRGKS